jgi:hypothetical protein
VKSTRPVVLALALPRLMLRLRFGKPRHPSCTYAALKARYFERLAAGGSAGRFAPSPRVEVDQAAARSRILSELDDVSRALGRSIGEWPDAALDRYQLPHPLLGDLTLREMLFFTLYHHEHHMENVKRRLAGSPAA